MAMALVFLVSTVKTNAQGYTSRVQASGDKGTVIIKQDEEITRLVDGKSYVVKTPVTTAKPTVKATSAIGIQDSTSHIKGSHATYATRGFRIQVYSGDDSRNARQTARQMAGQLKALYPELTVYTRFFSPHWTCRAGDFRTREEASQYFHDIMKTGLFKAATIIKCTIQVSANQ